MGWSNSTFQLLIITASPAGFSGLFIYSPAPGAGNLIASITAAAGTDPYGNAYLKGDTSYANDGFGTFIQELAGILVFGNTTFPNVASGAGSISESLSGSLVVQAGTTGGAISFNHDGTIQALAGHFLVASQTGGAEEVWHNMSPLAAGYTAGTVAPRYRLEAVGSKGVVRLAGAVSLTANHAAGNTFFTLPAAYVPSIVGQQNLPPSSNNLSGFSFNNGYVIVSPGTGTLDMGSAGSNGNLFWLDGLTYSLD